MNRTGLDDTRGLNLDPWYPANGRGGRLEAVTVLPYPCPLFLPIQEGSKLPSRLAIPSELLDERFVIERPFDILRLARTVNENAV